MITMEGAFQKLRRFDWQRWVRPESAQAYAFAIILIILASLARWGLGLVVNNVQAFTTYYPAVLIAALLGGAGVGIFAALSSAVISWWMFLPPYFTFELTYFGDAINLLAYIFASLLIVWAADHYRRLTKRLKDEEKFRELTVGELAHRLKNKVATIQAIISLQLRENTQARDQIIRALGALSATDDLIMAAQGQGAAIREILTTELAPYDRSRISTKGPDCLVPPKLALTMALLFHELATNAAKYGAISSSVGKLSVEWSILAARLSLSWRETGGPAVTPPNHCGFGTRLFTRSLEPFGGTVETAFEPMGFNCTITVIIPERSREAMEVGDRKPAGSGQPYP